MIHHDEEKLMIMAMVEDMMKFETLLNFFRTPRPLSFIPIMYKTNVRDLILSEVYEATN